MRKVKCGMMVVGPQVTSRDRNYYTVYCAPRMTSAVANCIMQMCKVVACRQRLRADDVMPSADDVVMRLSCQQ